MTFKEIQELIKLVGKSNLTEFKMKDGDLRLTIRTKRYQKQQAAAVPTMLPMPAPAAYPTAPAPPAQAAPAPTTAPAPAAAESAAPAKEDTGNYLEVRSPMVGTFYRSSSPDKAAFVQVGDTIQTGSVVCIVEAMKLFNEIEAEVSGKVVKVMVEDAQPVEYDQVLFLVEPA